MNNIPEQQNNMPGRDFIQDLTYDGNVESRKQIAADICFENMDLILKELELTVEASQAELRRNRHNGDYAVILRQSSAARWLLERLSVSLRYSNGYPGYAATNQAVGALSFLLSSNQNSATRCRVDETQLRSSLEKYFNSCNSHKVEADIGFLENKKRELLNKIEQKKSVIDAARLSTEQISQLENQRDAVETATHHCREICDALLNHRVDESAKLQNHITQAIDVLTNPQHSTKQYQRPENEAKLKIKSLEARLSQMNALYEQARRTIEEYGKTELQLRRQLEISSKELDEKEAELQAVKEEFSEYKYQSLGSAISNESANYQDLNDPLRPGVVIEQHKDLRESEYLDVVDSLEEEDEEAVKRLLNSMVQESYELVREKMSEFTKGLTAVFSSHITDDQQSVTDFEKSAEKMLKTELKKNLKVMTLDGFAKEIIKRADKKDVEQNLEEMESVLEYAVSCVRFSFSLCLQTPMFSLDSSQQPFNKARHELEIGCKETSKPVIDYFVWPTLICNDEQKRVLRKGIVHLKN